MPYEYRVRQWSMRRGSIPSRVIPKIQKMVLDTTFLNTQHNTVRSKGKVEQILHLPPHLGVVVIEKWSLRVTLD